jgi:hypothetical protein
MAGRIVPALFVGRMAKKAQQGVPDSRAAGAFAAMAKKA